MQLYVFFFFVFFFMKAGGGGGGGWCTYFTVHHLPPTWPVWCFVVMSVKINGLGFVNHVLLHLCLRHWSRHLWKLFCGSPIFRMSTRRLRVLLFVSRIEYPVISCFVAWSACGGRRGFYLICVLWHVSNLRLIPSLLIIILLLLPPPWAFRQHHRSRLC